MLPRSAAAARNPAARGAVVMASGWPSNVTTEPPASRRSNRYDAARQRPVVRANERRGREFIGEAHEENMDAVGLHRAQRAIERGGVRRRDIATRRWARGL